MHRQQRDGLCLHKPTVDVFVRLSFPLQLPGRVQHAPLPTRPRTILVASVGQTSQSPKTTTRRRRRRRRKRRSHRPKRARRPEATRPRKQGTAVRKRIHKNPQMQKIVREMQTSPPQHSFTSWRRCFKCCSKTGYLCASRTAPVNPSVSQRLTVHETAVI